MYKYWYFEKAIPEDICDKIIEHGKSLSFEDGITQDPVQPGKRYRNTNVAWIDETWIRSIMTYHTQLANINSGWNFDIDTYTEKLQFGVYGTDNHYDWHNDNDIYLENPRKLSAVLMLSNDSEYEGGKFVFYDKFYDGQIVPEYVPQAMKKGNIIVFPSTLYHKVEPVISGERITLVGWTHGPSWR